MLDIATALNAPPEALADDEERDFVAKITEHGWFGTHVFADDDGPGFAFSTGFWVMLGQPEVIVFALSKEVAQAVLWDIYRELAAGCVYPEGEPVNDVFASGPAVFMPVDKTHYPDHLGWSLWFYGGDDFTCRQLIWPDRAGKFPWQPGASDEFDGLQPDLSGVGWATLAG